MRSPRDQKGKDGSFMRIEVMSMLKLVSVTVFLLLCLVGFVVVGFVFGPKVADNDYTSTRERCTKPFTLQQFTDCGGTIQFSHPQGDDGNVASIEEVLALPEEKQIKVLSCMFDKCVSEQTDPFTYSKPDDLIVAHYKFSLEGLQARNRYFYLEILFPNFATMHDYSFDVTVTPRVQGFFQDDTKGLVGVDVMPDVRQETLTVKCDGNRVYCFPKYFLRVGDIQYDTYHIDLLLNSTSQMPLDGHEPVFRKTFGTIEFTKWMLGFKYLFLSLSILSCAAYIRLIAQIPSREQNLEQVWVLTLSIVLCFFNDPFYAAEVDIGGDNWRILSLLFQTVFYMLLLLFWLIALDNLRIQGQDQSTVPSCGFYGIKILFIFCFWVILFITLAYIKYYANNDVMWDPLKDNNRFRTAKNICIVLSAVYLAWLLVAAARAHKELRAKRTRYRWLLLLSLVMIVVSFAGMFVNAASPTPSTAGGWTSYVALFNLYVFGMAYLFAPSTTALRMAKHAIAEKEEAPALVSENSIVIQDDGEEDDEAQENDGMVREDAPAMVETRSIDTAV